MDAPTPPPPGPPPANNHHHHQSHLPSPSTSSNRTIMKPRQWTEPEQRRLLLAIIEAANTRPHWPSVSALMGGDYNITSLRRQFSKLRKESTPTTAAPAAAAAAAT
ncbi:hypothetical protein FN846DRAFT_977006, partial [Sphaerosporella brunnea]